MRLTLVLAAALLALAGGARAQTVAFTGLRLIDGVAGQPLDDAVLVIEDGRVAAAGRRGAVSVPAGAETRDYAGRTVIPGLISDHSHVGLVKGVTTGPQNYTREVVAAQLRAFAAHGVTTVMALGLNGGLLSELRAEAHAGRLPGADLFGVDRGIGVPDGAPPQAMVKVDTEQLFRPANAGEAREAVRAMKARGTDMVKLWLDDFGGAVPAKMQPAVYEAVIDEAHRLGLRVAAHVHDLEDARAVVRAGVDVLAHGVRDRAVDPGFVALMRERGTWYVATLALDEATVAYAEGQDWTRGPAVRDALSPEFRAQTDDPAWRAANSGGKKAEGARSSLSMNLANLKTLHAAGVRIGFGTDSGAAPERVPGVAEHRELALTVRAGLTPMEALTLATARAADLLGLTDRGRLVPGARADFVVLAADPSVDIAASTRIVEVWRGGKSVR